MGEMVNINYELPPELHQALKLRAVTEGITLKELIVRLLTEALEQKERP